MSVIDLIMQQLQGGGIDAISRQVGVAPKQTETVVSGAVPLLIAGLSRNTGSSSGLASLAGALDRDHDGSVLDDVAGFLGGSSASSAGAGILGHILGGRQPAVASSLSKMSGVDASKVTQILAMVAPLVMGALGREKRQQGLDLGSLAGLLGGEQKKAEKAAPGMAGMLGSLLDADGDGSVGDEVADLGSQLLGSFFGKKR